MSAQGPNFDPQVRPSYEFLPPTDERLYMPSELIPPELITSPEIQGLGRDLLAICRGELATNLPADDMVGLALPQLGIMKSMFVVDMGYVPYKENPQELHVFINSEVFEESPEKDKQYDGCYSIPPTADGADIWGVVQRPRWIRARAYNLRGVQEAFLISGFTARVYTHEDDHVHGIVFPDRMEPGQPLDVVTGDEISAYGRGGGWQHGWHRHITFEEIRQPRSAA